VIVSVTVSSKRISLTFLDPGLFPQVGRELERDDVAAVITHDDDGVRRVEGDVRQLKGEFTIRQKSQQIKLQLVK
jgi:hypothetical protein